MKPSFPCPACHRPFTSRSQRRFVERLIPKLRAYRCDVCAHRFLRFPSMSRHRVLTTLPH